jgi:Kef-type K+ transport system membrane component KefB/nucleotide-binding universal stress UspA family protein
MHFLLTFIIQLGVILVAARLVGLLFRYIRQPQVVGEMAAGILLGPSLLGWVAPEFSAWLFPPQSLVHINTVSQLALLLFMFLVGVEFNPKLLRGRGHAAVMTSHVSIVAPFFLGSVLALYLYPQLSDRSVGFTGFALFMGAAMSVTAFPVLARILIERNLLRTKVGAVTIACAAVDDVTAWSILAVVIVVVRADSLGTPLWLTFAGTLIYIVVLLFVVRPALRWLEQRYHNRGHLTQDMLAVILLALLASAWTTEFLGIHALFGAFCIGVIMPKDHGFVHEVNEKLGDLTVVFLLPLFFANAGLRTSIGLVSGVEMWGFFGLIMLVAVGGKFGGSTLAARVSGLSWRESSAIGILMNTRGLMELVILTIGLDLGVISPALFSMMVLMALVTTAMTTPILQLLYPGHLLRKDESEQPDADQEFVAMLPVSLPASGPGLLRVAQALVPPGRSPRIYGMHLRSSPENLTVDFEADDVPAREQALQPMLRAAEQDKLQIRAVSFVSQAPSRDIVDMAKIKGANLIVMGWHKPVVTQRILGGIVSEVLANAASDVVVYVERHFEPWRRILVPYRGGIHDAGALEAAGFIAAKHPDVEVVVFHLCETASATASAAVAAASDRSDAAPLVLPLPLRAPSVVDRVKVIKGDDEDPIRGVVNEARQGAYELVVIGVAKTWGLSPEFIGSRSERIVSETLCSLLVIRKQTPDY